MSQLIKYELEDGGYVYVEIEEPEEGMVPATRAGDVAAQAEETFESALDRIRPMVTTLVDKIRELEEYAPSKVEIECGIKMNAKVGAVVASIAAEPHYKLTLTWDKEQLPAQ